MSSKTNDNRGRDDLEKREMSFEEILEMVKSLELGQTVTIQFDSKEHPDNRKGTFRARLIKNQL